MDCPTGYECITSVVPAALFTPNEMAIVWLAAGVGIALVAIGFGAMLYLIKKAGWNL